MKNFVAFIFVSLIVITGYAQSDCTFNDNPVLPNDDQVAYQEMEITGFVHFTITTFYNREWGKGSEDPKRFNPSHTDVEQWVRTAKAGGVKQLILTAKHHDGFCLWPSKYTEHSIKNSPYKRGQGDLVREFVDACHKYGIKVGLYLSPWDRNHKDYGRPEYLTYYKNQLTELLTNYGPVSEIWFDGANGGTGYYGGAKEKRTIDKNYYPWNEWYALVKKLQPNCLIFSDIGPGIRWVGNEQGHCGETFWSTINSDKTTLGHASTGYLNTGEPNGKVWQVGECDVSIRPGWFFHAAENKLVKSPAKIAELYYESVGRNGVLLVNLPPDKRGLINSRDSANFANFKSIIDETFKNNLATGAKVTASSTWQNSHCFSADHVTDTSQRSFWAAAEKDTSATLNIELLKPGTFNRIMLQEPIRHGQRISGFKVMALVGNEWQQIAHGTTIGYKRLLKCNTTYASKIRVIITSANNTPAISKVGLFMASDGE